MVLADFHYFSHPGIKKLLRRIMHRLLFKLKSKALSGDTLEKVIIVLMLIGSVLVFFFLTG